MTGRKPNLKATILLNVENLFDIRGWPRERFDNGFSTFQRYCERISIFDLPEQQLFLDISNRFEQIQIKDYTNYLWEAYKKIDENILGSASNIVIMPLQDLGKPFEKTKSSRALHYFLTTSYYDWVAFSDKIIFCESIDELNSNIVKDSLLLLIDDFVGSGKTGCTAIKSYLRTNELLSFENVSVLSIVSQEEGIERIYEETKCIVYSRDVFRKGISNHYDSELAQEHIKTMISMEAKISPRISEQGYSLGFEKSEALVSFSSKTPNNTFPVFWFETETKMSPFPRHRKYKSKK